MTRLWGRVGIHGVFFPTTPRVISRVGLITAVSERRPPGLVNFLITSHQCARYQIQSNSDLLLVEDRVRLSS